MAEQQETRQEQEIRWAAQRVENDKELQASQAAKKRRIVRNVVVGVLLILVAVGAAVVFL